MVASILANHRANPKGDAINNYKGLHSCSEQHHLRHIVLLYIVFHYIEQQKYYIGCKVLYACNGSGRRSGGIFNVDNRQYRYIKPVSETDQKPMQHENRCVSNVDNRQYRCIETDKSMWSRLHYSDHRCPLVRVIASLFATGLFKIYRYQSSTQVS